MSDLSARGGAAVEIADEVVERVRDGVSSLHHRFRCCGSGYEGTVKLLAEILTLLPAPPLKPLPCPWCGETNLHCWNTHVACVNDDCEACGPNGTTRDDAIHKWNAAPRATP